jgi:hypothetical protein
VAVTDTIFATFSRIGDIIVVLAFVDGLPTDFARESFYPFFSGWFQG